VGKPQREVDPFRDELRDMRQALGRRIRELRTARGWSQEFADKAHVHRTFAGSLERGEKNCSFHALILIARCLDMTVADMLVDFEAGKSHPLPAGTTKNSLRRSRP
jgi:transcriptional regulator with XRE-family HTH domain